MQSKDSKMTDLPSDVVNLLAFLEDLCSYGKLDRKVVHEHVPAYIFDKRSLR